MKRLLLIASILLLATSAWADIEVCFTPGAGCEAPIVAHIAAAKVSIRVMAYGFTSRAIADALVAAKARGADVEVILDRSNLTAKGSEMWTLLAGHVPTWVDGSHRIFHDKVLIFDGRIVETGSFNFTTSAEHANAENAVFIVDAALAQKFLVNWERHRAHSQEVR